MAKYGSRGAGIAEGQAEANRVNIQRQQLEMQRKRELHERNEKKRKEAEDKRRYEDKKARDDRNDKFDQNDKNRKFDLDSKELENKIEVNEKKLSQIDTQIEQAADTQAYNEDKDRLNREYQISRDEVNDKRQDDIFKENVASRLASNTIQNELIGIRNKAAEAAEKAKLEKAKRENEAIQKQIDAKTKARKQEEEHRYATAAVLLTNTLIKGERHDDGKGNVFFSASPENTDMFNLENGLNSENYIVYTHIGGNKLDIPRIASVETDPKTQQKFVSVFGQKFNENLLKSDSYKVAAQKTYDYGEGESKGRQQSFGTTSKNSIDIQKLLIDGGYEIGTDAYKKAYDTMLNLANGPSNKNAGNQTTTDNTFNRFSFGQKKTDDGNSETPSTNTEPSPTKTEATPVPAQQSDTNNAGGSNSNSGGGSEEDDFKPPKTWYEEDGGQNGLSNYKIKPLDEDEREDDKSSSSGSGNGLMYDYPVDKLNRIRRVKKS